MSNQGLEIKLPFTETARKYGYIIWRKKDDAKMRVIFLDREIIDLKFTECTQEKKKVDWKKRRVGITYTITRNILASKKYIYLRRVNKNQVKIMFN